MMNKISMMRLVVISALFASAWLVHPAVGGAQRTLSRPQQPTRETVAIVPVGTYSIGNSLGFASGGNLGYGFGLFANGITDYLRASNATTNDFVFFVYPGKATVTQVVSFAVTSPSGATVFTHTYQSQKFGYAGTWYTAAARGDWSAQGTYTASVYADGNLIGSIPVVVTN
jgi:hypothetical protein